MPAACRPGGGRSLGGRTHAANVWGAQSYLLEQLGFRKLVDTTFVMGFLVSPEAEVERAYRWMKTWDLIDAAKPAAGYHEAVLA